MFGAGGFTTQQANVTVYLFAITFFLVGGLGAYWAGYEDYVSHFDNLVWYLNFLTGIIPIVGLFLVWWFGYAASFRQRAARTTLFSILMLAAVAFICIFVVVQIVVWTQCTDHPGGVFDHPHCVNVDTYPAGSAPKVEFYLTFFGAISCGVGLAIAGLMASQLACAAVFGSMLTPANMQASKWGDGSQVFYPNAQSQIGCHLDKSKPHKGAYTYGGETMYAEVMAK